MLDKVNDKHSFIRNCIIIYVLVGFCSAIIADSHKYFMLSSQSSNNAQFSRIVSFSIANQARHSLYK